MNKIKIANSDLTVSEISLGLMRIAGMAKAEIAELLHTALDEGIDFFDHADIYGGGQSEAKFAEALDMNPRVRETMYIQSKCGIGRDHLISRKSISLPPSTAACSGCAPTTWTSCFCTGPMRWSNPKRWRRHSRSSRRAAKSATSASATRIPMQIELLKRYVKQPLIFNQLQLSITNTGMIDAGLNVNMEIDRSIDRDNSILDYCRLHDITIQPWSPFQYGFFEGTFLGNPKFPELNQKIDEIAAQYNVTNTAIAVAWLLRHPARMQPILGTTNPQRVKDACQASGVRLSRQEWYAIYLAAGNKLP